RGQEKSQPHEIERWQEVDSRIANGYRVLTISPLSHFVHGLDALSAGINPLFDAILDDGHLL
ncbi:MAG: hypothetical protein ACE5NP_08870, partial [Anaerolineae bacterium]